MDLRQMVSDTLAFLWGLIWPAVNSVRNNAGLAAVSVVLGFALWIFVTDTDGPTRSGVLPFDVAVEPVNVPSDLAVAGSPVNVRVRVEVADDVWPTLTQADFRATVDLNGLQAGTYDLPVKVDPLTGRGGLRVVGTIPETVTVELKALFSKSVEVSVVLEGAPPPGFQAGVVEVSAETVLVTGTQDRVTLVSQAVATLNLTGRTEDTTQAVRLEARDSRGFLVEGVSLEPSVVNVAVEISQTQFSRALVISPSVTGTPESGYEVVSVAVDPPVITVFGPSSFIVEAATIRTQTIDITGATDDVVRTVSLDLPPNVTVSGGTTVTVTIQIEPGQGRITISVPMVATGLDPDLQIVGALPPVDVTLLGELPTLREVRPTDVSATIDLTGLEEGTHQVEVNVTAPEETVVSSASPQAIELTLEAR